MMPPNNGAKIIDNVLAIAKYYYTQELIFGQSQAICCGFMAGVGPLHGGRLLIGCKKSVGLSSVYQLRGIGKHPLQ